MDNSLLEPLRRIHAALRDVLVDAMERQAPETLSAVADDGPGDTQFVIDRIGEDALIPLVERELAARLPLTLIAEGLDEEGIVLPRGTARAASRARLIVDPIDGTRGLMVQKRPAWILSALAPELGPATTLRDVTVAVMTEIPLVKQHLSDVFWACRGQGAEGERWNRLTREATRISPRPSRATDLAHGFAQIARFFPGLRDELASIDEEICQAVHGPVIPGKAQSFEDQYISSGGQLAELLCGHDRFTADLRPLLASLASQRGAFPGICSHPYDLCTELVAREAGVLVTKPDGTALDAPLDTVTDVAWVGYANASLRARIEPALHHALRRRGLMHS